jgi:hypothetical protein
MGYYRAGGQDGVASSVASGELGNAIGTGLWKDPTVRNWLGLPPGQPFDTYTPQGAADMGYYSAGGAAWSPPSFGGSASTSDPMGLYGGTKANASPPVDAGSGGGRRRARMNPTNVRALRRSMRRVVGFAKIARRVMTFTHAHKMKGKKRGRFGK